MTTLTTTEIQLLDEYIIRHNYTEFDEAYFHHILANTLPSWRSEHIASSRVYDFGTTEAYQDYIKSLYINSDV
jgi:hypothetical protein